MAVLDREHHKGNWCPHLNNRRLCQEDYCDQCEVYNIVQEEKSVEVVKLDKMWNKEVTNGSG